MRDSIKYPVILNDGKTVLCKTKIAAVKLYLEQGRTLTSLQAIKFWTATRLSAIIFCLREDYGMEIKNLSEHGDYAIYSL